MKDFIHGTMNENSPVNERTSLITSSELAPSSRRSKRTWPVICIILSLLLERTAYYGILCNLAFLLTVCIGLDRDTTIACVLVFTGTAWLMSTFGGIIGDSYSGRFHAIWGSLIIYIIGAIFLEVAASIEHYLHLFIGLALLFLSIGEGAFKANISAFGAEQLLTQDAETYRRFFSWFYWSINIGSFIGYSLIAYVQVTYEVAIGYALPLVCLVFACIIFLIPSSKYKIYPLTGNVLKRVYGIIKEAISLRKGNTRSNRVCPGLEEVMPIRHWLDRAMCKYGGSYLDSEVSEVKTLGRISVMFLMFIPYWMIYYQMNSTFLFQGLHMDLRMNKGGNETSTNPSVPAAWLTLADVILVLLLIPLMDKVVYPWLEKKHCKMSVNKRISIGFLFAIASMIAAGIVEYERNKISLSHPRVVQTISRKQYNATDMIIFYQVPQYALIGISEVFASVGSLEFAYREAPESMHGFVMGLFYLIVSLGSLLGAGLYEFSSKVLCWTKNMPSAAQDLGKHFDYYFYLLGGILFITWLIFIVTSGWYEYKNDPRISGKVKYSRLDSELSKNSTSNSFVT